MNRQFSFFALIAFFGMMSLATQAFGDTDNYAAAREQWIGSLAGGVQSGKVEIMLDAPENKCAYAKAGLTREQARERLLKDEEMLSDARQHVTSSDFWKMVKASAEGGDASSCTMMGINYEYGICQGIERDPWQSAFWFRKAAEQGDATAMAYYGVKCLSGDGTKRNYAEGCKFLQSAAEQGNGLAQTVLKEIYQEEQNGRDFKQAYDFLTDVLIRAALIQSAANGGY